MKIVINEQELKIMVNLLKDIQGTESFDHLEGAIEAEADAICDEKMFTSLVLWSTLSLQEFTQDSYQYFQP